MIMGNIEYCWKGPGEFIQIVCCWGDYILWLWLIPEGWGTPILDQTGRAAQQGVLCSKIMQQGIVIGKKIMRQSIM